MRRIKPKTPFHFVRSQSSNASVLFYKLPYLSLSLKLSSEKSTGISVASSGKCVCWNVLRVPCMVRCCCCCIWGELRNPPVAKFCLWWDQYGLWFKFGVGCWLDENPSWAPVSEYGLFIAFSLISMLWLLVRAAAAWAELWWWLLLPVRPSIWAWADLFIAPLFHKCSISCILCLWSLIVSVCSESRFHPSM